MRIQVAEVGEVITQTGKNNKPYKVFEFAYYNNGKKQSKKITQFSNVYKTLQASAPDQLFEITTQPNGQYTEWVDATPSTATADEVAKPKASVPYASKNTYETPEERAVKQERITRIACLNTAVTTLTAIMGKNWNEETAIQIAKKYKDFVYDTPSLAQDQDSARVE